MVALNPTIYKQTSNNKNELQIVGIKTRDGPKERIVYNQPLGSVVARRICKDCNYGWMNQIEESGKGVVMRLIDGGRAILDADDQHKLASWLCLKFLVLDKTLRERSFLHQSSRDFFFQNRVPLPNWQIWIGISDDQSPFHYHIHSPTRLIRGDMTHINSQAFKFGKAFAQYIASDVAVGELTLDFSPRAIGARAPQVWPVKYDPLVWPPSPALTDDELWFFIDTLSRHEDRTWKYVGGGKWVVDDTGVKARPLRKWVFSPD